MKAVWNIVKTDTGTKCHPDTVPSVLEKDDLVINPDQAADAFNNYFLELLEKLKLPDVPSRFCYFMSSESQF
jgi:hypothetical protein